jgi:hypothetical protein
MRSGKDATIGYLRTALKVGLTTGLSVVTLLGVSGQAFADQPSSDTYSYSCAYTGEVFEVRNSTDMAAVDEYCAKLRLPSQSMTITLAVAATMRIRESSRIPTTTCSTLKRTQLRPDGISPDLSSAARW